MTSSQVQELGSSLVLNGLFLHCKQCLRNVRCSTSFPCCWANFAVFLPHFVVPPSTKRSRQPCSSCPLQLALTLPAGRRSWGRPSLQQLPRVLHAPYLHPCLILFLLLRTRPLLVLKRWWSWPTVLLSPTGQHPLVDKQETRGKTGLSRAALFEKVLYCVPSFA